MFTPVLSRWHNTSKFVDVGIDEFAQRYMDSLTPVELGEVSLLELLHTIFMDTPTASADSLPKYVEELNDRDGIYRDDAGTLVLRQRCNDTYRLTLLWPVRQPIEHPDAHTTIGGRHFLFVDNGGTVLPLSAADADSVGFGWGYGGTGPTNTYNALLFAVAGKTRPVSGIIGKRAQSIRPLHRWLRHDCDVNAPLLIKWPDLVRLVEEDSGNQP